MFCGPLYSGSRTKETMPPERPGWLPPGPHKGLGITTEISGNSPDQRHIAQGL